MNTSEMARVLGSRGGRARGARLSAAERKRIASLGGAARLRSLRAARRIVENLRYAAVLGELGGRATRVRRQAESAGPLPGIYASSR